MRLTEALLRHVLELRFEQLDARAVAATRVFAMDSLAVGIAGSGPQVPLTAVVRAKPTRLRGSSGLTAIASA